MIVLLSKFHVSDQCIVVVIRHDHSQGKSGLPEFNSRSSLLRIPCLPEGEPRYRIPINFLVVHPDEAAPIGQNKIQVSDTMFVFQPLKQRLSIVVQLLPVLFQEDIFKRFFLIKDVKCGGLFLCFALNEG